MKYGTVQFLGDSGKHLNAEGQECAGRHFQVKVIGRGMPACTNHVECLACHGQYEAYEDGLATGTPTHSIL